MAVTFDANQTAVATANSVTSITTSNLTVGAGANRALVVQVALGGSVTALALKWDNLGTPQSLAVITGATAAQSGTPFERVELWGLVAPTSGAKQLSVTWTTARDVYVNGVAWTGVDQTGGTTTFPHGTGSIGSGTTAQGITVTSATGNATMAVFDTGSAVNISSVNNTQTFLSNVAANIDAAGNRAAGAATVSHTATYSGAAAWGAAGTDILASAGAATFVPRNTYQAAILTQ